MLSIAYVIVFGVLRRKELQSEVLTIVKASPARCPTCGRKALYDEETHLIVWLCNHLSPQLPENYNYKFVKKC